MNICGFVKEECISEKYPSILINSIGLCTPLSKSLSEKDVRLTLLSPSNPEGGVLLEYLNGGNLITATQTSIEIYCDPTIETPKLMFLEVRNENGGQLLNFRFAMTSQWACPGYRLFTLAPVGIGGIVLICLTSIFLMYCILGTFLNCFRGYRQLSDAIPNFYFWKDVPFLLFDGIKFFFIILLYPWRKLCCKETRYKLRGFGEE